MDVAFTRSVSPHHYQFELSRADSQSGTYSVTDNAYASTSPADFDDQSKGYWYKARGRNCQTCTATPTWTGCGDWSGYSTSIHLKLSPPTNLTLEVDATDNQKLILQYDRRGDGAFFQLILETSSTETGTYANSGTISDLLSPAAFTSSDIGNWYRVRGRNCRSYTATPTPTWTGCGDWSTDSGAYVLRLFQPTELDVLPMPKRIARLAWKPVSHSSGYKVQMQKTGGGWSPTYVLPNLSPTTQSVDITLDRIIRTPELEGLADPPYSYEFRVVALHGTSSTPPGMIPGGNSDRSVEVRIIENPLSQDQGSVDGKSPQTQGAVHLSWTPIADVSEYSIRYRKLGMSPSGGIIGRQSLHHSHKDWYDHDDWPYYETAQKEAFLASPGDGSKSITGLTSGEIYAFQLNYETHTEIRVFSARDAYAYPSSTIPQQTLGADRVATLPMFGHWPNKGYIYSICDDTFPRFYRQAWINVIEHAFEQWESTTGIVEMTPSSTDCDIDINVPFSLNESYKNDVNEVLMISIQLQMPAFSLAIF